MPGFITYLGLIAGTLTTIAFFPQVVKTWKTKKTEDISLVMFLILCLGIFLWLVYGLIIKDLPLILANGITFLFASIILIFKIKYK